MRFRQLILIVSSFISLLSAVTLLTLAIYNKSLEKTISTKQIEMTTLKDEINRGLTSKQFAQSIIQDLASISASKPEVQALLNRIGITIEHKTAPTHE
jgi:hypothetical protein